MCTTSGEKGGKEASLLPDGHLGRVDKRQGKEDFVATQATVGQSFPQTISPEMNSRSHEGLSSFFLPMAMSPHFSHLFHDKRVNWENWEACTSPKSLFLSLEDSSSSSCVADILGVGKSEAEVLIRGPP